MRDPGNEIDVSHTARGVISCPPSRLSLLVRGRWARGAGSVRSEVLDWLDFC